MQTCEPRTKFKLKTLSDTWRSLALVTLNMVDFRDSTVCGSFPLGLASSSKRFQRWLVKPQDDVIISSLHFCMPLSLLEKIQGTESSTTKPMILRVVHEYAENISQGMQTSVSLSSATA